MAVKPRPRTRPRKKGRPHNDGSAVGRDALVRSTIDLLRSQAPATLNLSDIARYAGVDPGLIRYYFKDKDGLFTAAASAMLDEFNSKLAARSASKGTAEERFRDRIRGIIEQYLQHPNFHEMVVNQIVRTDPRHGRKALAELASGGGGETRAIMEQGIKARKFRDVDARFMQVALVGACGFFVTARPFVEAMFKGEKVNTATAEAYGDFVTDLFLHGLKPQATARKSR